VRSDSGARGIANGIATLGSDAKVTNAQIRRPIVSSGGIAGGFDPTDADPSGVATTSSTSYVSLFSTTVSLTTGLPMIVFGQIVAKDDAFSEGNTIRFRVRVTRPSMATTDLVEHAMPGAHPNNNASSGDFSVCFVAGETGLHTFDLQWRGHSGAAITALARGLQVIQFGAA
jgi:hypothetical protein